MATILTGARGQFARRHAGVAARSATGLVTTTQWRHMATIAHYWVQTAKYKHA
ncbi:hypothetical protein DPMN_005664 [Dreissena polymorpha]|uniref:Uncharacterized protein n=1 Tax=Dreissena polymorpha TaxID=45954 RepID=A0A9D4MQ33_DREPO|nr:hypothetical protein DPMN_005664 [Dreissena polymorpha]